MRLLLPISVFFLACLTAISGCDRSAETTAGDSNGPAERDYLLTVSRPNTLNLIDLHTNKVVRQCTLPGVPTPGTVVISPDKTVAYVLSDRFSDVFGYRLDDCELVFSSRQSSGNQRVKTMASLAVSPDGSEVYTHQNRVTLHTDHYRAKAPRVAVFDTAAGLDAPEIRSFEAPRQVTIMKTGADGQLYLAGPDIYRMDVNTGEYQVVLASRSLEDPAYGPRDILSVWPLGEVNGELYRMYSVAKYRGESGDMDNADFLWGYERVDLETGATESRDFGPLEVVLFTSMRRPGQLDQVYGTLNELKVFDAKSQSVTQTLALEHAYYCINFSTDGSRFYLSGALSDVAVYDAESFEKLANVQLGGDMGLANSHIFKRATL